MYTKSFLLDTVGRVWDVMFVGGFEDRVIVEIAVEMLCAF